MTKETGGTRAGSGSTETHRIEGTVIVETTYRGRVSYAMGIELAGRLSRILDETPRVDWLVVLDEGASLGMAPLDFIWSVLRMFKGNNRIAAVIPPASRLKVLRQLNIPTGGHLVFFDTRDQALAFLMGPGRK
jgi:hypothetical protein